MEGTNLSVIEAPTAGDIRVPETRTAESAATAEVPGYLARTYRWAYLDDRNARLLDRELVVKTILWGQHRKLEAAAFAESEPGQNVLQTACVYGQCSPALAAHIGCAGQLKVIDVASLQVARCRQKLAAFPQSVVEQQDVVDLADRELDAAVCYFLLHELPDAVKYAAVSALLETVRVGGKAVFVDYHEPHRTHPLKPVINLVFALLEPYAKGLWHNEIKHFAGADPRFSWHKETYFGGLYQKVVATRLS